MGVPTFFRWLTMRNPKIVIDCYQPQQDATVSGNPEIDNFYIDMNGLIHPSCNPQSENIKTPTNFEQQCNNIFEYIDKIINIVRPKRLLYLAIDGVAPRAKMNQQRSRRFRAAQESLANQQKKKKLKMFYQERGIYNQEIQDYVNKKSFDSNVITPGTQFLSDISIALNYFVHHRMNNHPQWKNLVVVFSDANCPGQGQHKIMQFIRQQRACEGYDPNMSHCLYGADADLIMLGLMTHEPKFYIIRQTIVQIDQKRCTTCGRQGHFFMDCRSGQSMEAEQNLEQAINVQFQLIKLQLVRDQLHFNFHKSVIPFGYDLERVIDDFIFMCFFVGNDFLPHLPSLNIRQGGIDVLLYLYEHTLFKMEDYLINAGVINLKSLDVFISELGKLQDTLITEAIKKESRFRQRQQNIKLTEQYNKSKTNSNTKNKKSQLQQYLLNPFQKFKGQLKEMSTSQLNVDMNYSQFSHPFMNYKQKFYTQKFRISPLDFYEFRAKISQCYIEALSWICLYYYKGVPSWSWHYPFHYSPFASDIKISLVNLKQFQIGRPFKPFEQLMAVFPPKTSWAVPECLQQLMRSHNSPISDYFPSEFVIDVLGKKFTWLGQVLLPFIDQQRLLKAMENYQEKLNEEQKGRNRLGSSLFFFNPDTKRLSLSFEKQCVSITHSQHQLEGHLRIVKGKRQVIGGIINSPFENSWESVQNNAIECYFFKQPQGKEHCIQLKPGAIVDDIEVDEQYSRKIDKRSYGGEWMIRTIDRLIQKPKIKVSLPASDLKKDNSFSALQDSKVQRKREYNRQSRDFNREKQRRSRSRSRDRQKSQRQNKDSNNYQKKRY